MLDLRVAKKSNGGLVGLSPEFSLGKVKRIVEANNRVQLLGKCLQISLGLRDGGGGTTSLCRGKGGRSCDDRGEDGELHGCDGVEEEVVSLTLDIACHDFLDIACQ